MMCVWLCLACALRPTNHEPVYGICHIGERIIRGCASAVLRDCNMIELVHTKLTHIYAANRRQSGMHVGRASVMLSAFQFFRSVWVFWIREGYWIPPKTCNSGRLYNLRWVGRDEGIQSEVSPLSQERKPNRRVIRCRKSSWGAHKTIKSEIRGHM